MILLPQKPKLVQKKGDTGYFEIQGLYPGYGVTMGNTLRRVLLSSLEGGAITQAKIKGANHEFSTISGVLEDVVIILLNLKKLNFRSFSDEPQTIVLKVKGQKKVKAKDFKLTSEVKLANPEQHIATLTKATADIEIECLVEKGVGYEPVEKREQEKAEVGVLPIDAIFTPVRRVATFVENMRVGKRTDFDKLKVEIETNGVITPEEAFDKASQILLDHFSLISEAFSVPKEEPKEEVVKKIKLEDLKISERAKTALEKNKIKTIAGLVKKTEKDLLEFEGMGQKAVDEIKKALKKADQELKA